MAKKRLTVKASIPDAYYLAKRLGVDKDGDVQEKVTDEVVRNLPDFMPKVTGKLISSIEKKSPTLVKVSGVQARFLFFGLTDDGEPVNYTLSENPNAGPHWDRRMVAARGAAIARSVRKYVRRRR